MSIFQERKVRDEVMRDIRSWIVDRVSSSQDKVTNL